MTDEILTIEFIDSQFSVAKVNNFFSAAKFYVANIPQITY